MKDVPSAEDVMFKPDDNSPDWFLNNLKQQGKPLVTLVNSRAVNMLTWSWDQHQLPVLFLVHGFGAHSHWWSFLAPFFSDRYRVAALDLPGFGDSEPPLNYHDGCFAEAICACIEEHDLAPVTIIGHSFGGAQSIRAMGMAPHLFNHGIIADTNVRLPPEPLIRRLQPKGTHKLSSTHEECMARFRLMPPQPTYIAALIKYIAFHSCTHSNQGWHWKADPNVINVGEIEDPDILEAADVPIDMVFGENSFLNIEDKPARVMQHFPKAGELIILPGAGHHMMIDCPLELVSTLNTLLS